MPHRALPTLAVIACFACRIEPTPGAPLGPPDGAEEPGSVTTPDESTGGFGGNASTARGGGSGRPPATGGAGAGGEEDEPSSGACDATAVTLDEVRSGAVLSSVTVALVATATSQKFLVSETDAGNCLWGAFLGDEPTSDEPRGVAVVSYGNPAPGDARCEPGTDAIPDELAPGDVVRAVGRASSFVPSSCGGTPAIVQLMAEARCPFERLRRTTPPEPVQLPLDVANGIARGDDPSLTRRWAGGLVRLLDVSALPNESGDGAVRAYGVVALAETELEVHTDIEYGDLTAGGPRDASKGIDFAYPAEFRSITGLVTLDYCDYALAPRRRCEDFDPPSLGCP